MRTKYWKLIILSIVFSFLIVSLAGCGIGNQSLVGKWTFDSNQARVTVDGFAQIDMEYFEDGTVTGDTYSGVYTVNGSQVIVTIKDNPTWTFDYKITGSKLEMTKGGETHTYTRVK
jgi:hypothetical protein